MIDRLIENNKGFSRTVNIILTVVTCLAVIGIGFLVFKLINRDGSSSNNKTISFKDEIVEITVGESKQLVIDVDPADAEVKWSSNNLNVTVDENGVILAKDVGESTIYAAMTGGDTAKCEVIVVDKKNNPLESEVTISISPDEKTLKVGEKLQLNANILGTSENPIWSSDDESVASVSSDGEVEAIAVGKTLVKATIGSSEAVSTIIVEEGSAPVVTPTPQENIPTGKQFDTNYVKLSTIALTIDKGSTETFDIAMTNAVGVVSFTSENTSIATVSDNQLWMESINSSNRDQQTVTITGKEVGTTTISVNLADVSTFDTVQTINEKAVIVVTVK